MCSATLILSCFFGDTRSVDCKGPLSQSGRCLSSLIVQDPGLLTEFCADGVKHLLGEGQLLVCFSSRGKIQLELKRISLVIHMCGLKCSKFSPG